ncbi:glutathione S-transferase [Radiomyces spectabilis]|uniref:glutathione S-transferase n=1 Tax=Radiomyces spectabilis TaxID=64574 RepID=UPI00221F252F|nr:glutathione S-transferase [Radiomyces spectabilis]KAI8381427.1 glutathione S-transferase [Radiomyces spectabilis]
MSGKLTFYNAVLCPFAQRVAIALREVGADFESVEIDLSNKPAWYKDVNPETKVPALSVNGVNIAESLVLLELLNDLYPEKKLLPNDAVKRAEVRFLIEYYSSNVVSNWYKHLRENANSGSREDYIAVLDKAYRRINDLLLAQSSSGPYFLGNQLSLADIAVAPFAGRIAAFEKHLLNGYEHEAVKQSPRLAEWFKGLAELPSFKDTFFGDKNVVDGIVNRFNYPTSQ